MQLDRYLRPETYGRVRGGDIAPPTPTATSAPRR
jgi:hypothetical protein